MAKPAKDKYGIVDFVSEMKRFSINEQVAWYATAQAYEGNHFLVYERQTGKLTKVPLRPLFNPLPEVKKQTDAFENLLTKINLQFFAYPKNLKDASNKELNDAYYFSLLLQDYFREYKYVFHQAIHDALVYPVSFIEVAKTIKIDDETGLEVSDVEYIPYDVFDIVFDPRYPFEKQRRIVKILRLNKEDAENNPLYRDAIKSGISVEGTFNDYKTLMEQERYSKQSECVLFEAHIKESYIKEIEVRGKKYKVPSQRLRIVTTNVNGEILRDDVYEDIDFFTIVPIHLSPLKHYYHPSFAEEILPINRSMDLMNLRVEDFLLKYTKGQWLKGVNDEMYFTDESGVIIEYEGNKPELVQQPNLSAAPFNYMGALFNYAGRYGVSDINLGKAPRTSNIRSEGMLEYLSSTELGQKQIEFDNYIAALEKIANITIFFLHKLWKTPRTKFLGESDSELKPVSFVSSEMKDIYGINPEYNNLIYIPKKLSKLRIGIDENFGSTLEEKRRTILALVQLGVLKNPKNILKYFAVGNVADIVLSEMTQGSLLENQEFVELVNDPNTPQEVKNAMATILNYLAQKKAAPNLPIGQEQEQPIKSSSKK